MKTILITTVGSRAHGTSGPDSDTDTRSVFVLPTCEVVGIGNYQRFISNPDADDNSFELAHFIYQALRCNPTILEILLAPADTRSWWGAELQSLFPAFLNRRRVYGAFKGFAIGQRKKIISPTTNYFRKPKASAHFLRVLYNGIELLQTGTMTIKIMNTPIGETVLAAKQDRLAFEEVLEAGDKLLTQIDVAEEQSILPLEADNDRINKYLLNVRKSYWEDA